MRAYLLLLENRRFRLLWTGSTVSTLGDRLLVADNLVRGAATAAIPLLYALGRLRLWHLFVAAALYGTLPLGGAFAPLLVSVGGLRAAFACAVAVIAIPGLVGLVLPALADEARRGS